MNRAAWMRLGLVSCLLLALALGSCRKPAGGGEGGGGEDEGGGGGEGQGDRAALPDLPPLAGSVFSFDEKAFEKYEPAACPAPPPAAAGDDRDEDRTGSPYFVVKSADPETDRLPLESTRADVSIAGLVAEVRVTQVYKNEGKNTLEAVYTFPASTRAAVHAMRMTVGDRTIEAKIREKQEAREEYEQAKKEGKTASLLEQERPNVFQMSVANILPGDVIKVEMIYNELLVPEDDVFEFVYPTVVGPRYESAAEKEAGEGGQWSANPTTHEGEPPAYTFGLDALVSSPVPIACLGSGTHPVTTLRDGDDRALVSLEEAKDHGDRDFVLRYSLAGEGISSGVLLHQGEDENFFMLMANPPEQVEAEQILPREYVFVVDVSGSMWGYPMDLTKKLMGDLLDDLGPEDYFNVITFSGAAHLMAPRSLMASKANVEMARKAMESTGAGGGTELVNALDKALALPKAGNASRIFVLVTDGYVTADETAIAKVRENLGEANMFTFGIGTSVNRHLIEGLARAGQGEPLVITDQEDAEERIEQYRRYIFSPIMRNIQVSFDGFDAYDVEPMHLPFLWAGRPVVLHGKYRGEPSGTIVLDGETSAGAYHEEFDVAKLSAPGQTEALRYLWARHKVQVLTDLDAVTHGDKKHEAEITKLGLEYSLLTQYTSFVAVDTEVRADGTKKETVRQPLPLPSGVSDLAMEEGSIGLGNLSTIGHGGGGGTGVGYGRGTGALRGRGGGDVPEIKPGKADVKGSLDKEVIRRVVRQHINEVRFCYEQALASTPSLAGKVVVEFVISAEGEVQSAKIVSSTLGNAKVEKCITKAVLRWTFPSPEGGGIVVVKYPFEFEPAE